MQSDNNEQQFEFVECVESSGTVPDSIFEPPPPQIECTNCGNSDPSCFNYSDNNGIDGSICALCGCINQEVGISELRQNLQRILNTTESKVFNKRNGKWQNPKKFSYDRKAYINERFNESRCKEPEICDEDKEIIKNEYNEFINTGGYTGIQPYFIKRIHETGNITKRDIQRILRSIDTKNKDKKKSFSQKYLGTFIVHTLLLL
jgi:hypothetical protein